MPTLALRVLRSRADARCVCAGAQDALDGVARLRLQADAAAAAHALPALVAAASAAHAELLAAYQALHGAPLSERLAC